jgi:opacity protein-like surface antigen
MRRCLFVLAAVFCLTGANRAHAQNCCPAWEVFGGYAYLNASADSDRITSEQFNRRYGMHGFGINFSGNLSSRFGIAADFSYHARKSTIGAVSIGDTVIGDARAELKAYNIMFGPRLSARSDDSNFFIQAMAGVAHRQTDLRSTLNTGPAINADTSAKGFALGFGGGADIRVARNVSIRLFQFDYIPVRVRNDSLNKVWTHNYRLQAGVVFNWGLAK